MDNLTSGTIAAPIDTANHRIVARGSKGIIILRPPIAGEPLDDEAALSLAAWLVAMVDPLIGGGPETRFAAVLRAIRNT